MTETLFDLDRGDESHSEETRDSEFPKIHMIISPILIQNEPKKLTLATVRHLEFVRDAPLQSALLDCLAPPGMDGLGRFQQSRCGKGPTRAREKKLN